MTPFELKTKDGLTLRGRTWHIEKPKAMVCLVHGHGEHSGRYNHVAEALNAVGFEMTAVDLRGHGLSDGPRGHAASYAILMSDLHLFLDDATTTRPELPVFLYGHSLGGNLVLYYAIEYKPNIAGIVASAPALRLAFKPPIWKTTILRLLKKIHLNLTLPSGLDDTALSRDLNTLRAYRNDPLTHCRISPPLAIDMITYGEELLTRADELEYPTLLLHGSDDRITSSPATREFSEKISAGCTLQIWEGLLHELHNEPEKNNVLSFISDWLESYS